MKYFTFLVIAICFLPCSGQKIVYDRDSILDVLLQRLNKDIPEYKHFTGNIIEWNQLFIHDLVDIDNKETTLAERIKFIEGHIYHLAPMEEPYSFSYIVFIGGGELKIFEAINCKDRGDSLEDVITFFQQKFNDCSQKVEIEKRIKRYREYGKYIKIDSQSALRCNCEPCN